jgi:hypothetical protein
VAEHERVETESMPLTEPYRPTFDTGMQPRAEPAFIEPEAPARRRWLRRKTADGDDQPPSGIVPTAYTETETPPSEAIPVVTAPGLLYLKWWKFILILLAVWVPAAAAGAGLFYWWSHDPSKHKTTVVFVVLAYVVVTTVAGLILAMVSDRPLVSALSIAMLSAVFAAVIGAAPVYGKFYCEHSQRHCAAGVLPY